MSETKRYKKGQKPLAEATIRTALTVLTIRREQVVGMRADAERTGDSETAAYWALSLAKISAAINDLADQKSGRA